MFGLSSIEFFNWIVGQVELFTENIKLTAAYHNYMHVISPCKCSWWQVIYCINSWLTWTYLWECEHFVNAYPCSSSKTISSSLNSKFHFGLCISLSLSLVMFAIECVAFKSGIQLPKPWHSSHWNDPNQWHSTSQVNAPPLGICAIGLHLHFSSSGKSSM